MKSALVEFLINAGIKLTSIASYKSRPITLINPFPPGGAADVVGRPFAAVLEPIISSRS